MVALLGVAGVVSGVMMHLVTAAGIVALGAALLHVRRHQLRSAALHRQELALRKEVLSYLLFNGSVRTMEAAELGRQLSRLVAVRSSFGRAAFLLRDGAGSLCVAGSAGFDDLSVEALNRWGSGVSDRNLSLTEIVAEKERVGTASFTLTLDRRCQERNPLSTMSCKQVHIVPLRTAHGMIGALVVCAEPRSSARSADPLELTRVSAAAAVLPLADLLQPLEALALRLTMQLTAPENLTPVWPARVSTRPNRHQDRHARSTKGRERPAAAEVSGQRRNVKTATPSAEPFGSAAVLERIRSIVHPAASPGERVAGVSGRPPIATWRPGGGLSTV